MKTFLKVCLEYPKWRYEITECFNGSLNKYIIDKNVKKKVNIYNKCVVGYLYKVINNFANELI